MQESEKAPPRRSWFRRFRWVILLVGLFLLWYFWWRGPSVPDPAVLTIDISVPVPEREDFRLSVLGQESRFDLLKLRRAIVAAGEDPRIRGILLRAGAAGVSWAQAEEIRELLENFRRRGKFVVGFGRGPDGAAYLVLCAASLLVLDPAAEIQLLGIGLRPVFLGDALRAVGIEFDLVRAGESKGTYEQLRGGASSPELKRTFEETADALYGTVVAKISAARQISPEDVRLAIDDAPISPARALKAKLADRVAYADELADLMASLCGGEKPRPIDAATYLEAVGESSGGAKVAVIHAEGILADAGMGSVPLLGEVQGVDEIRTALRQAREDPGIKGILLRIDSPGGTTSAAERLWREVDVTRKVKPVVASMGSLAASGGYYIACGAEWTVAHATTITGSIGVFGGKLDASKLMDRLQVRSEVYSRGRRAGLHNWMRPFSDDERVAMERTVQETYRLFLDRVAVGRKKPFEEAERLARGRIWTGKQAAERGLVDDLGGMETALGKLRELAKLPEGEALDLVPFPPRRSVLDLLRAPPADSPAGHLSPALSARAPAAATDPALLLETFADLIERGGGTFALLPYCLRVR